MKKRRSLVGVATLAVFISAAAGVSYGLLPSMKSTTICLLGELRDKSIGAYDGLRDLVREASQGTDQSDRKAIDEFVHGNRKSIIYDSQAH